MSEFGCVQARYACSGRNRGGELKLSKGYKLAETIRFAKIVEKAGEPEPYTLWQDPDKDKSFQSALKAHRVMTVHQASSAGSGADYGEVGYVKGQAKEILTFPKSLKRFEGKRIVGIKYDLLSTSEKSRGQSSTRSRPREKPKPKPKTNQSLPPKKPLNPASGNVVAFKSPVVEGGDEIAELKEKVRHAMKVLEDGKPVAAFNLLKRIVE